MEKKDLSDPWVQRPKFRALVDAWLLENPGRTKDDLAKEINLAGWKSLKQYYSGRVKVPGRNLIQSMIPVLKCQASDLMDDPGALVAGNSTAALTEKRRFLASLMFEGISAEDLSDEDAQFLYEDHLAALSRLRAMKARVRPPDGTT